MTFQSYKGRAGRSLVNSLLRLVGARVVARLAFATNHLGLPTSGPPPTPTSNSPRCPGGRGVLVFAFGLPGLDPRGLPRRLRHCASDAVAGPLQRFRRLR